MEPKKRIEKIVPSLRNCVENIVKEMGRNNNYSTERIIVNETSQTINALPSFHEFDCTYFQGHRPMDAFCWEMAHSIFSLNASFQPDWDKKEIIFLSLYTNPIIFSEISEEIVSDAMRKATEAIRKNIGKFNRKWGKQTCWVIKIDQITAESFYEKLNEGDDNISSELETYIRFGLNSNKILNAFNAKNPNRDIIFKTIIEYAIIMHFNGDWNKIGKIFDIVERKYDRIVEVGREQSIAEKCFDPNFVQKICEQF